MSGREEITDFLTYTQSLLVVGACLVILRGDTALSSFKAKTRRKHFNLNVKKE